MKKIVAGIVFVMLISVFAFAEFVITPTVGFSDFSLSGREYSTGSAARVNAKTSLTSFAISLDLGVIAEKGFTFLWDNNLSFGGKMKHRSGNASAVSMNTKGAFYTGNFLFGYTFKGVPNLYINLAAGLGSGIGVMKIEDIDGVKPPKTEKMGMMTTGIPIHLGAQYFFTKNIGLNLTVMDIPSYGFTMRPFRFSDLFDEFVSSAFDSQASNYGYSSSSSGSSKHFQAGFTNIFILKIGPVFKF